jgi:hypothetical protein
MSYICSTEATVKFSSTATVGIETLGIHSCDHQSNDSEDVPLYSLDNYASMYSRIQNLYTFCKLILKDGMFVSVLVMYWIEHIILNSNIIGLVNGVTCIFPMQFVCWTAKGLLVTGQEF